jgi:hypothetical protein
VGGARHAKAALLPGKTRYPLYRRLVGPYGRTGHTRKFSPPPGLDPRNDQPVASLYTDYASPARPFKTNYYMSLVTLQNNTLNGDGMGVETLILSLLVRWLFISDKK